MPGKFVIPRNLLSVAVRFRFEKANVLCSSYKLMQPDVDSRSFQGEDPTTAGFVWWTWQVRRGYTLICNGSTTIRRREEPAFCKPFVRGLGLFFVLLSCSLSVVLSCVNTGSDLR